MKSYQCAIALGSNLGDSLAIVRAALDYLASTPEVEVVEVSHWYRTKPVTEAIAGLYSDRSTTEASPVTQPDYINGCALLRTSLMPNRLLAVLLATEAHFGRERRERWGARTLDLDILLYENFVLDTPNLTIPHPRMCDRAFVLLPLAEIVPDWIHPINGSTIGKLAIDPPDIYICSPQKLNSEDTLE
ncbi:2-amino-4-hydroxy-6-hydroxymethyldihydropteridine diphosphokinase [Pseudanabaena sp. PCC 6802]|uniref:2-amino-4-hydroxy-6- hydroxymethyldihydropteridine diphosphokinase n=1 Tax=Pseudanabaena sp. PCC 6802 TaxID=118173 RepID=UPI0004762A86